MAPGQGELYEQVKKSIANELDDAILKLDFAGMLKQLKLAVTEMTKEDGRANKNALRLFCRRYLQMPGQTFKEAQGWFSGEACMPDDKILLVLRTLKSLRDSLQPRELEKFERAATDGDSGGDSASASRYKKGRRRKAKITASVTEATAVPKTSGATRKLIDHTTTTLNSLMLLIVEFGVVPSDLFDGDRMQMRIALKELCDAFGITVNFPEPEAARSRPVTRQDFAEFDGLEVSKKRKGRE